jgi:hypothetical protein
MGQVIGPGSSSSYDGFRRGRQPFFVVSILREHGIKGVIALLVAAAVAFIPLIALVWFNTWRLTSVVAAQCSQPVVVKPGRFERDKENDEPGDTALLQVTCEVPCIDGWRELLCDEDPVRRDANVSDWHHVRNERVYLRKASDFNLPFGLLGRPPVSVWLPAGDYEIAVVHETPKSESRIDAQAIGFPFTTVFDSCSLSEREKTVRRIQLPHYDWGGAEPILPAGQSVMFRDPTEDDLRLLLDQVQSLTTIPTPGGYLFSLGEPQVSHVEGHRQCTVDFNDLQAVPREWTRNQIATLRNSLPTSATAAREKLNILLGDLQWREMFEGWFCYAAAGIAGLVFTRWGALAILEPGRHRETLGASVKRCLVIFLVSALAWFLFQVLTDSHGCSGPMPFRMH